MSKRKNPVFNNGRVHVCAEKCPTCIFHPGNRMDLRPGRVADMVREAKATQTCIPCHERLWTRGAQQAVCRGFYEHHATIPIQVAERLGMITFVGGETK